MPCLRRLKEAIFLGDERAATIVGDATEDSRPEARGEQQVATPVFICMQCAALISTCSHLHQEMLLLHKVNSATSLRACYGIPGTDCVWNYCMHYGISTTDLQYGATGPINGPSTRGATNPASVKKSWGGGGQHLG
eukprot:3895274-Rhodomonas_salina.1